MFLHSTRIVARSRLQRRTELAFLIRDRTGSVLLKSAKEEALATFAVARASLQCCNRSTTELATAASNPLVARFRASRGDEMGLSR